MVFPSHCPQALTGLSSSRGYIVPSNLNLPFLPPNPLSLSFLKYFLNFLSFMSRTLD